MKIQHGFLTRKSGAWLGHFSKWFDSGNGTKTRIQKAFVIGPVSEMSKLEARLRLRSRIEQEHHEGVKAHGSASLEWFIENRWKPLREGTWRGNTAAANKYFFSHLIKRFGSASLMDIDAVELQTWLNGLAKKYSGSVVRHVRLYAKSVFVEAVEQDYIRKSPARLLRLPVVRPTPKPFLSREEIKRLLEAAEGRDRLLLRIVFATALRPSELFALRWSCFDAQERLLRITESVYRGKIRAFTKTTDERSDERLKRVFLPEVLVRELEEWRKGAKETAFIFPNESGNAHNRENFRNRVLIALAKKAEIPRLNFQILRRSVATHMQAFGSPQDIAGVMRHTKPSTAAEHYVQVLPESVRQATERLTAELM